MDRHESDPRESGRREAMISTLRALAAAGLALPFLGACASGSGVAGGPGSGATAGLPEPRYPTTIGGHNPRRAPVIAAPKPMPQPDRIPEGLMPRSAWAGASPIQSRMNRADRPFDRITVHHDGMTPFSSTTADAAKSRIEQIRRAHLNRTPEPFGDIGYHYLIDPAGRVWEGRSTQWQGAHVARQNPGNLGICMLGNYNNQTPNRAQQAALNRLVLQQMRAHRVPISRVYTHQELASTACPGNSLQAYMRATRGNSGELRRMAT